MENKKYTVDREIETSREQIKINEQWLKDNLADILINEVFGIGYVDPKYVIEYVLYGLEEQINRHLDCERCYEEGDTCKHCEFTDELYKEWEQKKKD